MPFGVQGDITRPSQAHVESLVLGATAFAQFGLPGKVSGNKFIPVAANNDVIYGFLARPFPITGASASDPLGTSVPPATGIANVLKRGYISALVQLNAATCALGSGVFVRYQNPSGSQIIAGVEGATTGNNYQILTATAAQNTYFTGPADANNLAEVAFNI